jgi:hypothetical protein
MQCGNGCYNWHISGCSPGKREVSMTSIYLYILGIALVGLFVWKFLPDEKRP